MAELGKYRELICNKQWKQDTFRIKWEIQDKMKTGGL
jgi:hypothetical protein